MANDIVVNNGGRIGWFIAGAIAIAACIGIYLYADGYFDRDSVQIKLGPASVEIEGQ